MNHMLSYLKNPIYCDNQKPRAFYLLFLVMVYIISIIPVALIILVICRNFHIEQDIISYSSFKTVLLGIILAPIIEEIMFRSLLKFTKSNVILFIIIVSALIVYTAIKSETEFLIILSILLISILFFLLIASRNKIELFISSNFKYFLYASAITFGLAHASNFNGNIYAIIAFSLILGGPQIIMGLISGFVRMNYGLIYSIMFHMMINSILLLKFI